MSDPRELIDGYLDGELTPEQARELADWMASDPANVERFVRETGLHRSLRDEVIARGALEKAAAVTPARRRSVARPRPSSLGIGLGFAAAALAAAGLIALVVTVRPQAPPLPMAHGPKVSEPKPVPVVPVPAPPEKKQETPLVVEPKPVEPPFTVPIPAPRQEPPKPESRPEVPPPPAPEPSKPSVTLTAVARIEQVHGMVQVLADAGSVLARVGEAILEKQGLSTGKDSLAMVKYADGTVLELGADTIVRQVREENGKRLLLVQGKLTARVTKQAPGKPLVITTPQSDATVLGTTFRLAVDPAGIGSTRLDVTEGRVRLTRLKDSVSVDVPSGSYAVAAAGVQLSVQPFRFGKNMLADPGFENDGLGWTKVKSGVRSIVTSPVHAGTRANQHVVNENTAYREVAQVVAVESDELYEAGGWVRFLRVEGGVRVELQWLRAMTPDAGLSDPPELIRTDVVGPLTGSRDWTSLRARFRSPADAKAVRFRFMTDIEPDSSGMAWFDDMYLGKQQ